MSWRARHAGCRGKLHAASGFALPSCTVLALILANSPWSARFAELWQTRVGFVVIRTSRSCSAQKTGSLLDRLETALHRWVAFRIMPLFALANAAVNIELSAVADPVALAVAAGLALGKPLGHRSF